LRQQEAFAFNSSLAS